MSESHARRRNDLRVLVGSGSLAAADTNWHEDTTPPSAVGAGPAVRVMIAAGHTLIRAGYRALLEADARIEVVADAANRRDAVQQAAEAMPHVALIDMALVGSDDPEAVAALVSHPAFADVAVMLIALPDSDAAVLSALRAGAVGVLADDAGPAELVGAVQLVAAGKALLPAGAMRRLLQELTPHRLDARAAERLSELTAREREVVALAAAGLSNAEIADRLVISTATARTHVSRSMIKLHARHRAQLAAIAYETGLVRAAGAESPQRSTPPATVPRGPRVVSMAAFR